MGLQRRSILALGACACAAPAILTRAVAADISRVQQAVESFATLPASASCLVVADHPTAPWQAAHEPAARLFIGSAVKTFILAQFLREVEAGRLSEDKQEAIDDSVRSLSSPVFLNLSGTTTARSLLEAMITHSDNTATDVTLAAIGAAQVRALIAEAGLTRTQIPDSTRRLFSYLAGAPEGVDLGWEAMQAMAKGQMAGTPRAPLNDRQTMASPAEEMVCWHRQALRGAYFKKPETLVEFKRIQAMADAIGYIAPPGTIGYAKGGSIDWQDFHCFSIPGQLIVGAVPVSFCFTINWSGPDDGVSTMFRSYTSATANVLREAVLAVT